MTQGTAAEYPTVLVILGATGDLMARKITPALWNLYKNKRLPRQFKAVGFAKDELTPDQFVASIEANLREYGPPRLPRVLLKKFQRLFQYQSGRFEELEGFQKLSAQIHAIHEVWGVCANTLFYLAVPPPYYQAIFNNLASAELTRLCSPEESWTRVLVEKPFGRDAKTAQELDQLLGHLFTEEQVYRIDHYLAKEMIQNILAFRFANNMFDQTWSADFIERIEIRLWEKIGVEKRGAFYDGIGALRDVGQNHLLQMLALVTMDQPSALTADAIRLQRAALLHKIQTPRDEEVRHWTYRAQYKGYREAEGVASDSTTETYCKFRLYINSDRWRTVPVILESGKRLGQSLKEVVITFKHPMPCLCPSPAEHHKNRVVIRLEPAEHISIHFWSKRPGFDYAYEERTLEYLLRPAKKSTQYVEEYEKLLLDCIAGDQTLFVSTKEVAAMWKVIDPIIRGWERSVVPLHTYELNTDQPSRESRYIDEAELSGTLKRKIGIVGLGKMGGNVARRLKGKGWKVWGYNKEQETTDHLSKEGVTPAYSLRELISGLTVPRLIWLMVPAGKPVDEVLFGKNGLSQFLSAGDIVIDAGNSFYKDAIRRFEELKKKNIHFIDVGMSGGPSGALQGASLMIGGSRELYERLEPLFAELSVINGYQFFEGVGAGHFVKMIHNGIEYGMMQAIAEGFTILRSAPYKLTLTDVARVYNHGTVIESRLLEWLRSGLTIHGEDLSPVSGTVRHTGEGEWTVQVAREQKLTAAVIETALQFRKDSERNPSYTGKILTALRNQFGGHPIQ